MFWRIGLVIACSIVYALVSPAGRQVFTRHPIATIFTFLLLMIVALLPGRRVLAALVLALVCVVVMTSSAPGRELWGQHPAAMVVIVALVAAVPLVAELSPGSPLWTLLYIVLGVAAVVLLVVMFRMLSSI